MRKEILTCPALWINVLLIPAMQPRGKQCERHVRERNLVGVSAKRLRETYGMLLRTGLPLVLRIQAAEASIAEMYEKLQILRQTYTRGCQLEILRFNEG